MIKSKKIKVLIISILCILTITIGLSYGYYLLNKVQENNNIAGSKCFNLEFTNEKNAINLDNMYPISDEEGKKLTPYSFTITNTCDILAGYTVNMEMLEGTTLNSKYLDVMVNNEQIKLLTNYESTDTVITGSTESRILAKGTLAYNDSVDYTVRFWMDKDVEDTESMNKLFKSKIVISATPSSWNPKDAGYDTLHDAILANEYQTTSEDAIKKIEAKGTPDLSQTAPVIKWLEKVNGNSNRPVIKPSINAINSDNQTKNIGIEEYKMRICTERSFDSSSSRYNLSNCELVDPTELNYDGTTNYYYSVEYVAYDQASKQLFIAYNTGAENVFQIVGATKNDSQTIWNDVQYDSVTYNLETIELGSMELESVTSDKGIYKSNDNYGTTYYYRGNVTNNNIYFAGFYWQIARINGDGSIRIMYNGTKKSAVGLEQSINTSSYQFNDKRSSLAYVGYMYGDSNGTSFDEIHNNTNSSSIKTTIDNWYKANIIDNEYDKYVSKNNGFCGDRSLYDGDGIDIAKSTLFGAFERFTNNSPQYKCPNIDRDLYTVIDAGIGNKALTYPVGLITYDELAFSGILDGYRNKYSWSYSANHYWTMSPARFYPGNITSIEYISISSGSLYHDWFINNYASVRPVINLKSDVKITGGIGTSNDPFVIDTSK